MYGRNNCADRVGVDPPGGFLAAPGGGCRDGYGFDSPFQNRGGERIVTAKKVNNPRGNGGFSPKMALSLKWYFKFSLYWTIG